MESIIEKPGHRNTGKIYAIFFPVTLIQTGESYGSQICHRELMTLLQDFRGFFSSQIFKDFRGRSRTFEGSPLLTFISIELLGKSAHGRTIFKAQLWNGNKIGNFSGINRMVNGNRLYSYYSGILGRISSVK